MVEMDGYRKMGGRWRGHHGRAVKPPGPALPFAPHGSRVSIVHRASKPGTRSERQCFVPTHASCASASSAPSANHPLTSKFTAVETIHIIAGLLRSDMSSCRFYTLEEDSDSCWLYFLELSFDAKSGLTQECPMVSLPIAVQIVHSSVQQHSLYPPLAWSLIYAYLSEGTKC